MNALDITYIAVYSVMLFCSVLWFAAYFANRKTIFKNPKPKSLPAVTFVLPAHNSESTIETCVRLVLALNYPKNKMKVIVVDDGSTDRTAELVRRMKNVVLVRQRHGGKASAVNNGLRHVTTELVACMDTDSYPDKNYLLEAVGHFNNPEIVAVSPALKVAEVDSLMRRMQWVEYIFSIFLRKLFSVFDTQYVVPGPGGIYRTSMLKKVGGFAMDTLTEDMEIAFRFIDHGYRLENSATAYVYTDCPKTFVSLYKQRIRWYRGYWQNVRKYSHMILNNAYGNLGVFVLPINFVWMFILAFLLITPLSLGVKNMIEYMTNWGQINYAIVLPEFRLDILAIDTFWFFNILFIVLNLSTVWVSIHVSREKVELRKRLKQYISFLLLYPPLISIFWITSIVFEIMGARKKW